MTTRLNYFIATTLFFMPIWIVLFVFVYLYGWGETFVAVGTGIVFCFGIVATTLIWFAFAQWIIGRYLKDETD